jgi:hypothetical protein
MSVGVVNAMQVVDDDWIRQTIIQTMMVQCVPSIVRGLLGMNGIRLSRHDGCQVRWGQNMQIRADGRIWL